MTDFLVFETTHYDTWCDRLGEPGNDTIVHRVEDHYPDLLYAVARGEISEDEAVELWSHWGGRLRAATCRVAEFGYESSMECPPRAEGDEIEEDVERMEAFIEAFVAAQAEASASDGYR